MSLEVEVRNIIVETIADHFVLNSQEVTEDKDVFRDFGADSLDFTEIAISVGETFEKNYGVVGLPLPGDEGYEGPSEISKVGNLVNYAINYVSKHKK